MKNLFENASFGKAYKTRDGRKAIYWLEFDNQHRLIFENYACSIFVRGDGKVQFGEENESDIVYEWKEEINEKELDKIAKEYVDNSLPLLDGDAISCFKAGYRKAMEDLV